ncbi:MAG: DUF6261 family protein [Prevotellaceae bacterium]|jgi:hypothetical protein|nr:DUF6261 family protein [Prevotellaceae bacterium]
MDKKVFSKAELGRFQNAEHSEFHRLSLAICMKYASKISAPPLIDRYSAAVTQEIAVFKAIRRSEYTEKKLEVDAKRDAAYIGLISSVRVNRKSFDQGVRDAADHVYVLLDSYGAVTRMGYDAETAAIDSIVSRLQGEAYAHSVSMLGVSAWVSKLNELNAEFKILVDERAQEEAAIPNIKQKDARLETDISLKHIIERVEARITLGELTDYENFAGEYNVLVKHYNTLVHEHYGRTHIRTDIAPAIITPVGEQKYTGKPVFVIPEVRLKTLAEDGTDVFIELVFSVDFTVAYKNNISRGTATLTINGIGKYKGELTTTFNIGN